MSPIVLCFRCGEVLPNIRRVYCGPCKKEIKKVRRHRPGEKERTRQHRRIYRALHLPQTAATYRRWKAANPDRIRVAKQKRKHEKRFAPVEAVDKDLVFVRDGGRCHICQRRVLREEMTLDHIVPFALNGGYTYANLRLAHASCNSSRGAGKTPGQLVLILF